MAEPLLFELDAPGSGTVRLPEIDVPLAPLPEGHVRADLPLPEVSEVGLVRHFTRLSQLNMSVDTNFYPLGSCTMKYNPKVNDKAARLPGFAQLHPYQDESTVQGALRLMYELQTYLAEIAGLPAVTLQPAAGAHGELTGVMIIWAYHHSQNDTRRTRILVPDSAHGTNPATAAMCGYTVTTIRSDPRGNIDIAELESQMDDTVAGLMMTNPNTLGLFEEHIREVADIVHRRGGVIYCDGANMNAMVGTARPGDLGMDILHYNLHKTFSTPHGGGGPGAGATAVTKELEPFLPIPVVAKRQTRGQGVRESGNQDPLPPDALITNPVYYLDFDRPQSIGRVRAFYGNFANMVRGYTYIRTLGKAGLRAMAEDAVLNANYLRVRLMDHYDIAFDRVCMHEAVFSGHRQARLGVRTLDIAKRLIDFNFHPPTIYFPLIVEEALMIEPTETESKATLDAFIDALGQIADEAETDPDVVKTAPHTAPITRLDEVTAARKPDLAWRRDEQGP
jgi:glycine dehydrogenase subunit 2